MSLGLILGLKMLKSQSLIREKDKGELK